MCWHAFDSLFWSEIQIEFGGGSLVNVVDRVFRVPSAKRIEPAFLNRVYLQCRKVIVFSGANAEFFRSLKTRSSVVPRLAAQDDCLVALTGGLDLCVFDQTATDAFVLK